MKILHLVGARPNFMKVSPVMTELAKVKNVSQKLVHSGQHYSDAMSKIFFDELKIPDPDINLDVGSGTHTYQTATTMLRLDQLFDQYTPDIVMLYGDVNATISGALVCSKRNIPICHVEAGLRAFDRTMPEETNRIVTDHLSDLLFTPSEDANINLQNENIDSDRIHFVGNIMIDTLVANLEKSETLWNTKTRQYFPKNYGLVTLHRPSNVDKEEILATLMEEIIKLSSTIPIIFPVHPRTKSAIDPLNLINHDENIKIIDPVGYLEFLALENHASFVITDSGGVQEETTFLKTPCFTVRANTERPITITSGSNTLVGNDSQNLSELIETSMSHEKTNPSVPPLWDGHTAKRIANIIKVF